MLKDLIEAFGTTIDLRSFLVRLVVAAFLGFAAAFMVNSLYENHARARKIQRLLPLMALCMALVTTVVASSLSVAIGMVGAISVVRFRNVFSAPQKLVQVLLAMAMGMCAGIGAVWLGFLTLPVIGIAMALEGRRKGTVGLVIHLSGQPQLLSTVLPELQASYPRMRMRHCAHAPGQGVWSLAHPALDLPDLLQLRDFIRHRAPSLKISWEHAPKP